MHAVAATTNTSNQQVTTWLNGLLVTECGARCKGWKLHHITFTTMNQQSTKPANSGTTCSGWARNCPRCYHSGTHTQWKTAVCGSTHSVGCTKALLDLWYYLLAWATGPGYCTTRGKRAGIVQQEVSTINQPRTVYLNYEKKHTVPATTNS
jgi:hypothetical protein